MMKKLLGVFCALVCVTSAVRADSLTFRETYKDVIYTYYDEFEGYGYEVFPTIGLSGSGTITIPGLRDRPLNDFEDGSISLGAANLDSVDTIISGNANRLLVRSGFYDNDINGDPVFVEVGRITFVRNGDSLSFTVSFPDVFSEDSAVAAQIAGDDQRGMVAGSIDFRLQLDELEYSRRVYYKGTASDLNRSARVGGVDGEAPTTEPVTLTTVSITGAADYTKPTISITSPRPNQRITNEVFAVTGKAGDNSALEGILVRVNDGEFESVELPESGTAWTHSVFLAPGTNTIEAYSIDADGNVSVTNRVKCFRVLTNALTLIVSQGGTVMGVSNRQVLEVGRGYKAIAKPGPTNLFSYWSNSVTELTSTNPMLPFLMAENLILEAHFIPNPWLPNKGTYNGLILPIAEVATTNAGYITMMLSDKGKVTGKVTQGAQTRMFMGQLDLEGNAFIQIPTAPALALQLAFDLANGSGLVEGSVSNAAWQSPLHAELQVPAVAVVGKHTFAIPGAPAEESTNLPAGDGAGVLTVNANGSTTILGNLGEGTPLTAGSGLSKAGRLPVYAVQFAGRGLFIGWLNVSTSSLPLTVTGASLTWFKSPGLARQMTYLGGFNEQNKSLMGARYTPPPRGSNVLNWPVGIVMLDGGRLTNTISNTLTVAGPTLAAPGNTNKILLTLTASSGKLAGSFLHPVSSKSTLLNGYVLQMPGGDVGKGWFISTNESGYLDLQPAAP